MAEKKTEDIPSKDWMSEDQNQLNVSEWFGCIFIYLICFGRYKFSTLYSQRYHTRNVIVGYLLQLIAVFVLVALAIYLA